MIDVALRAAAAFVDDNGSRASWDPHQRLSDAQRFAKGRKISAVATDLRALADASETRKVHYAEYAVFKDRLYAFGLPLALKLDQDIAAAFRAAEGPARPRQEGWLEPS